MIVWLGINFSFEINSFLSGYWKQFSIVIQLLVLVLRSLRPIWFQLLCMWPFIRSGSIGIFFLSLEFRKFMIMWFDVGLFACIALRTWWIPSIGDTCCLVLGNFLVSHWFLVERFPKIWPKLFYSTQKNGSQLMFEQLLCVSHWNREFSCAINCILIENLQNTCWHCYLIGEDSVT